ncbi:MAG: oligosaccharide flippase family protein [Planctomycetota bacterium]|nr:oligosaccharide flippase family protein [Planctomycetota bacterium]
MLIVRGFVKGLMGSRFVRDSATLQAASMINSLGSLACALALAHVLGSLQQGEFYLAIATYSFLWFSVNLGLYPVATSQLAAAAARGSDYKVAFWIAYLIKALLWMGVAFVILAVAVLPWLAEHVYHTPSMSWSAAYGQPLIKAAALMAFTPLLELPRSACCAAFQGTRRMVVLAKVENGQECVRVFLVVAGAVITRDAVGPAVGMLLASCVGSILAVDAYVRETRTGEHPLPKVRMVLGRFKEAPLFYGLRLGLRLGVTQNMHALGVNILPTMVLGFVGNTRWVAYMRLAQRIVDAIRTLMQGINRTALPYFSELVGLKDLQGLRRAYWRATMGSGALVSTGVLLIGFFVPSIVEAFPSDYRDPVWAVFLVLAPGVMVVSFSVANDTFYLVTDNLRVAITFGAVQFAVHLVLLAVLGHFYPELGPSVALTIFFFSSVIHPAYAYFWFKRKAVGDGSDDGATGIPIGDAS